MKITVFLIVLAANFFTFSLFSKDPIYLKQNLTDATPGDYIVASRGKCYALLHVNQHIGNTLRIGEITVPSSRFPRTPVDWKEWVTKGAPGHTGWLMYEIDIHTGHLNTLYSVTPHGWIPLSQQDRFLSTLLNLRLQYIPPSQRKQVGPSLLPGGGSEPKRAWTPLMVMDGKAIKGVSFDAWKTKWPNDSSELSGKTIEVYVPEDHQKYPAYFPYWLQVSGMVGKAKIFIVDSGRGLPTFSPPTK